MNFLQNFFNDPKILNAKKMVEEKIIKDGKIDLNEVKDLGAQVLTKVKTELIRDNKLDVTEAVHQIMEFIPEKIQELVAYTPNPPIRDINPNGLEPGVVIIIHNHRFDDEPRRFGSEKDVEHLKETFRKYSMLTYVAQDPTFDEIKDIIKKVSAIDFRNRACFVIVIMTHGTRFDHLFSADGKTYSVNDHILFPLYKPLEGIPKIVFTQACKGNGNLDVDTAYRIGLNEEGNITIISTHNTQIEIDLCVNYPKGRPDEVFRFDSTIEGYVAKRHNINGSFFITSLCHMLNQHGETHSVQEIAEMVKKDLGKISGIQYPSINNSTISEPFYFGDFMKDEDLPTPSTEDLDLFLDLIGSS